MNSDIVSLIIILICVMLSAYFSATETSFTSLNRIRMKNMAEKGDKRAELVLKLLENFDKLLSTILVGNNIVNIAAASLGTILFVRLLGDMGATVSTIVLTVVVLRSYGGVIMSFPWKTGAWAWIAALCVVGGKCIGGFASDRFGEVRSATVTLSAAAAALIFSAFPLPGALGLLLFNMSMPVTLYAARDILREGRATAFGLLTLGLFLGMLPAFSGASGSGL